MTKKPLTSEELAQLTLGLNMLARNLWWTWTQEAQDIFQELSPRGWQNLYHNAVAILREVSDYELRVRLHENRPQRTRPPSELLGVGPVVHCQQQCNRLAVALERRGQGS